MILRRASVLLGCALLGQLMMLALPSLSLAVTMEELHPDRVGAGTLRAGGASVGSG